MRLPEKRNRPAGNGTASNVSLDGDNPSLRQVADELTHLQRRVVQDAVNTARREWWLRRAEDFERAKPRPGDFHGNATREQLSARWQWCHRTAQACRNKAALIDLSRAEFDAEIAELLDIEEAA